MGTTKKYNYNRKINSQKNYQIKTYAEIMY